MQRSRKRAVKDWCSKLLMVLTCALLIAAAPAFAEPNEKPSQPLTIGEYFSRPKSESGTNSPSKGAPAIPPYVAAPEQPQERAEGGGLLDFSEPSTGDWQQTTTVGESTFFDKLRSVVWSLAFVSLLIWGLARFLGRGSTLGASGTPTTSHIEILERKRLTPGRSIMLMRVGPKVLALAATESGFQTLTELSAEELELNVNRDTTGEAAVENAERSSESFVLSAPRTPQEIAKHYLSILPGIGVKR